MKKMTVIFLFVTITGYAQQWRNNLDDGFREASASGKNVLLFFSNSIDCERCATLDKNVLQSVEFNNFAKQNFVLVKQDFGHSNADNLEQNLLIVEKYNKDGFFPLVVILDKNAKILGQVGAYNDETPSEYLARLQSIKRS